MSEHRYKVRSLHQIEMTSECNLRCKYCVHPKMPRPKRHMADGIWRSALNWVERFVETGTQGPELNLAGIGESTMHPRFVEHVYEAREALGDERHLILATNGLLMTDELAQAIRKARPRVWVSLHRPEKGGLAVEALRRAGILAGVSTDPALASIDWAGQVDWHVSANPMTRICPWVARAQVMVMADGRVTTCCLDGSGAGVLGTVHDDLAQMETAPYSLCETCDMRHPWEAAYRKPEAVG